MIDLNRRLDESVRQVSKYGVWLTNGGIFIIIASIVVFVIEFLRLLHISRMPQIKSGDQSISKLQNQLEALYEQDKEVIDGTNLYQKLELDVENEKAVLMGNRESVIFVYMINCVACVLFFIIGILMWRVTKPTMEMISFLEKDGLDNVPADLRRHDSTEAFLIQRSKLKYCIYVSLFSSMIIFFSMCIRILITGDTFYKEEKMFMNYQSVKDRYGSAAEKDEKEHHKEIYAGDKTQSQYAEGLAEHDTAHSSLLFLKQDKEGHPNLIAGAYFFVLIVVLVFNVYNFIRFQDYQEKMAANMEDLEFSKKGNNIVIEAQ